MTGQSRNANVFECPTCTQARPFSEGHDAGPECDFCAYPLARTQLAQERFDKHWLAAVAFSPVAAHMAWCSESDRLRAAIGEAFALDTADRNHPDTARAVMADRAGEEFRAAAGRERGPSLTQALAARGLTHRPRSGPGLQGREVVDAAGAVVMQGAAHEVWAWLRDGAAPSHAVFVMGRRVGSLSLDTGRQ